MLAGWIATLTTGTSSLDLVVEVEVQQLEPALCLDLVEKKNDGSTGT